MREKTKREERIVKSMKDWREKAVLLESHRGAKYLNILEEQFLTPEEERSLTRLLTSFAYDIHKPLLYAHFNFLPYSIYIQEARTKIEYYVASLIAQYETLRGINSVYIIGENLREVLGKREFSQFKNKVNAVLKNRKTGNSIGTLEEYESNIWDVLQNIEEEHKKFIDFLGYTRELYVFSEYYFENFLPLPIYNNFLKTHKMEVVFNSSYIDRLLNKDIEEVLGVPLSIDLSVPPFDSIETPKINPEAVERIAKEFR
jgi:hypothetical protein